MGNKVGVTKEEKSLSYFKYYERPLAQIAGEKLALLDKMEGPSVVPFDKRNLFLAGEDTDYCQVGYGVADDGIGFVCNTTYLPGVTSEMLDWWFPWHSVGSDLRYKIWDAEDHYFATADRPDYVCDPNVPVNQKTWGVTHYVLEDIGPGPSLLKLNFMRPKDYGYDESIIGTEKCTSLVCAAGEGDAPAAMTHKWYTYKDGVMLCSRFWMGYTLKDGQVVRVLPEGMRVPDIAPKALYAHCIKEFTNLGAILPELYAENKDNF